MWLNSSNVFVSLWRCCVLVSWVQPVMTLRALFWVNCNFWRLVSDMFGDQTVLSYSMTGRIIVLYVARRVSFCLPQDVEVRDLSILTEESAFPLVILVCSPKLRLGSSVIPRIFGLLIVGIVMLLMIL